MSQPRTRSEGLPEAETSEEAFEEPTTTSPLAAQRRMS